MKSLIYSIGEIEEKSRMIYNERQIKKDWLAKHMEILSSKTVLKDLKLGESYYYDAQDTEDKYEKFRLYQQAIGHFYLAYFRSSGKDRKAERDLEKAKEEYHTHLFTYFLKGVDDFNYYKEDLKFLEELKRVIEMGEKLPGVLEVLEKFKENRDAYILFDNIMNLKEEKIDLVREEIKKYKNSKNEVIKTITKEIQKRYEKEMLYLESISSDRVSFIKANRIKIQEGLKFIRYFNSKNYIYLKNLITKFFSYRSITLFIENEYSYEDYEGLIRNYSIFERVENIKESNRAIEEMRGILLRALRDYNKIYVSHNFQKLFLKDIDFYPNYIYLVEKFIRKIESMDLDILKELDYLKNLDKEIDKNIKIEEIMTMLSRSNLTFAEELNGKLGEMHKKNEEGYDDVSDFSLKIIDKKMDKLYTILYKNRISIGRSDENDFVLKNKYISNNHILINLEKNEIINLKNEKGPITYVNNKNEIIEKVNIHQDRIREINLGNLFTYQISETIENTIVFDPLEEKTNKKYLKDFELSSFLKEKVIFLNKKNDIFIDTERFRVDKEGDLEVSIGKIIKIGRNKNSRSIKFGLNYFDNRFEYVLERI